MGHHSLWNGAKFRQMPDHIRLTLRRGANDHISVPRHNRQLVFKPLHRSGALGLRILQRDRIMQQNHLSGPGDALHHALVQVAMTGVEIDKIRRQVFSDQTS